MEAKKVTTIRIITVAAITFFILLLTAMVVNLIKLTTLNNRKAQLEREIARIEKVIEDNENTIDFLSSDEYVDKYAREYLDMIGKDEIAFKGK